MPSIDELSARYWDLYLDARPTYATLIGDHSRDSRIDDFTDEFRHTHTATLRRILSEVEATDPSHDLITRSLLVTVVGADLAEHETEILIGPVDPYLGPHSETLRSVAQTSALIPDHARDLMLRYRQIPWMLEQALHRQRRLLDEGRPPAAASVHRVLHQLDAYVASPIDTDPFVGLQLPPDWNRERSWRSEMEEIVVSLIKPAFGAYRIALADEILPRSRPDETPGICHLPGGEDIYLRLVERFVTVPYDPAEIHRIGRAHATEVLPDEYARIGGDVFDETDLARILERLRTDPSLRYRSAEEMLSHASEIVGRAWASIDGWLGARPGGPCRVLPVPDSLAPDMPPAYYLQPSPDGSRPGTYFLNTYQPRTRDRFGAEAVAFHEAIPGHHFDRALASALTDMPAFRRLRAHHVHAEGWGLYAERLADEMGLYSGPVERLGMVSADSWRAGRLVVDTGIHHLGWNREQAVDFLVEWSAVNRQTVEQEVDRYIGWPGQALSYKMGHIELDRLRAHAEKELGPDFDIVGFHDAVLTSGSVSVPVLSRLVGTWIESRRR